MTISGCLLGACQSGPPTPVPGVPVNCDAYGGVGTGSWRRVSYPEGVATDTAAVDATTFSLVGGNHCVLCQVNELPIGQGSWTTSSFDDYEFGTVPSSAAASADFVAFSDLAVEERTLVEYARLLLWERGSDFWREFDPPLEYGSRIEISLFWTGAEFLLWGGYRVDVLFFEDDTAITTLADGALFDPLTQTWRMAAAARPPVEFLYGEGDARYQLADEWTPDGLLVWGTNPDETAPFLAIYSPDDDAWTELEATNSPPLRVRHELVYGDGHVYLLSGDEP